MEFNFENFEFLRSYNESSYGIFELTLNIVHCMDRKIRNFIATKITRYTVYSYISARCLNAQRSRYIEGTFRSYSYTEEGRKCYSQKMQIVYFTLLSSFLSYLATSTFTVTRKDDGDWFRDTSDMQCNDFHAYTDSTGCHCNHALTFSTENMTCQSYQERGKL